MLDDSTFRGEITVASRIVDYLSSGLYESPAACLKELINNSYDADAKSVEVFVKPDADRIIIEDDGHGLNRDDFLRHFTRISESHKRDDSDTTGTGRPKIGKIGIGFIAANEICDVMEVYSTKAGSTELLHVNINFDKMREDPEERRRKGEDFAKGDYEGEVLSTDVDAHYTQVFLKRVRGEARAILAGARAHTHTAGTRSLYGLSSQSISQFLREPTIRSWSEFDSYTQNILQVGLNVPVPYYDNWMPEDLLPYTSDFSQETADLGFGLKFDGSEVHKPIVLTPGENRNALVSRFEYEGEHVSAKGYFYAQHGAIRPQEIQGLLIRIRHAAIGGYDGTFLGFSPSEGALFQGWTSAEIWADDRLEDAMNIDRRTLRVSHPVYVEFQRSIHEHLSTFLKRVRADLYGEANKARKTERAHTLVKSIADVADSSIAGFSPLAAAEVKQSWTDMAKEERGSKRVLKKFTLSEVYEIFAEVAGDILSAEQLQEVMQRLTKRLSQ
jgi:hypothetical protein